MKLFNNWKNNRIFTIKNSFTGGKYLENRHKPMPGEIYRHFKGKLYQIVSVATHTETEEELVVYQALYGEYGIYARPLAMFTSKVDTVKYAEVTAVYRFELYKTTDGILLSTEEIDGDTSKKEVNISKDTISEDILLQESFNNNQPQHNPYIDNNKTTEVLGSEEKTTTTLVNKEGISMILMEFLDATSFREKLEIVQSYKKDLTDKIINDMAMSIDCAVVDGDMDDRIASLTYCLQTRIRFESRRFR